MTGLFAHLRRVALGYPETYEESPWGDRVAKVRTKVFVMYGQKADGRVTLTVKLPHTGPEALERPDTTPTGYGLGRSGWVTAVLAPDADRAVLEAWVEESFRAVAPKTLSRTVPEGGPGLGELPVAPEEPPSDAPLALVVSDDALRAERTAHGLARAGIRAVCGTTEELALLADQPAAGLVVDLGRSFTAALATAQELAMIHFDGALCLAGIRDAKAERAVREALPGAAIVTRSPPGDPRVVAAVAAALRS
jgi:predicted DNA-binding protein (MmcQ/YjbR family)